MWPALWLTVQVGRRRVPVPLLVVYPLVLVLDVLTLLILVPVGLCTRHRVLSAVGARFVLSRLVLGLIVHGRGLCVRIRDGRRHVAVATRLRIRRHT